MKDRRKKKLGKILNNHNELIVCLELKKMYIKLIKSVYFPMYMCIYVCMCICLYLWMPTCTTYIDWLIFNVGWMSIWKIYLHTFN